MSTHPPSHFFPCLFFQVIIEDMESHLTLSPHGHTHISLFFLLMLEQLVRGECTVMFHNHWFFKMSGYNKYCWLRGKCCTLECSAFFYRKYGVEVKVLSVICFSLEGYFWLVLACHRLKTYIIQCCSEWYTCSCAFTLGGAASEFQI